MVVAINKIDKTGAQPEKAKKELAESGVLVEELQGKVPSVNVSAKTGEGVEELLETILLVAEIENLKVNISKPGEGTIIESYLDSKKGPIATLILEGGTLKEGGILATSSTLGKAKSLSNFQGEPIETGSPSQPVSVLGFARPPGVGERFKVYKNQEEAQKTIKRKEERVSQVLSVTKGKKVLNIILKTDVLGSGEAIEGALRNIPQEKVILRILKVEVGDIGISDIKLAEGGKAKIFGFRVKIAENVKAFAQQRKIGVKIFEVIYELVQEVRREMENVLEPEIKRVDLGKVKISVLFKKGKEGQIVGGKVIEGEVEKDSMAEILRGEEVVGKGKIQNLQIEKKDIQKAGKGKEVGVLFAGEASIEEGDILQFFKEERTKGEL